MDKIIEVRDVSKRFKGNVVLEHVNLDIEPGMIYGLTGINGSGKTVLMKLICGFLLPDSGKITVYGKEIGRDRDFPENTGIIIETPGFSQYSSGFDNLRALASIQKKISKDDIRDAMRLVGLDPDDKKRVSKYSLGMRQRLGIAQAIMEGQELLLLDEPMNGLDQEAVANMRELFLKRKSEGKTMLLASHNKEDIQALCDVVYCIDRGKIN